MFKPKSLAALISLIVGGLVAIATIAAGIEGGPKFLKDVLFTYIEINVLVLFLALTLLPAGIFLFFNSKLFFERAVHENTRLLLQTTEKKLADIESLRGIDFVTGIPNQIQFKKDIAKISQRVSGDQPYQLIFFDLNNFGFVNKRFGYTIGDRILEYFARCVYESMRRNESFYKFPFNEDIKKDELWRRAYRKYTGGDEFIVILRGVEAEAIGFLVRLQRDLFKKYNPEVQFSILNSTEWKLSFSAAIVQINKGDEEVDLMHRIHDAMRIANQPGSLMRVVWHSKKKASDFEKESWQYKIYEEAILLFHSN